MRFSGPAGGFGIKKRSGFGGGGRRPAFMEPLSVVPPRDGGGGGALTLMRKRMSSFPLKEDAGYIGYLTDDESGNGDEGNNVMKIVERRRRELIGSDADVSFSTCMFMMITAGGLLMLFLFAASPWGVPPPMGVRPQ
jgi:hypothetical protein